ncbi:MAG: DUF11 domain-containing protein, partial [Chloroflexi bacterium]
MRAAVMEANAQAGADSITIPAGTYTLTLGGIDEDASATGDLNILSNMTITGAGGNRDGDPAQTIIQAGTNAINGIDRVFSVNSYWTTPLNVTIEAVTIRYGRNISDSDGYGSGIDWEVSGTGNLTVYNCVVSDNYAKVMGGGIFVSNTPRGSGKLTLSKMTVRNNKADHFGGGLGLNGVIFEISDSQVTGNVGLKGGGLSIENNVYAGAVSTISNSTISGNSLAYPTTFPEFFGGGIHLVGALKLMKSTVSGNTAQHRGAGIYAALDGGSPTASSLELVNTTVSGNSTSGNGGGLFVALDNGATPPAMSPRITLTNATITNNSAGSGGGIFRTAARNGTIIANNTIIAGNLRGAAASDIEYDAGLPVTVLDASSAYNLIGAGGSGGLTNGVNNNQVGVTNPRLGLLANNGGSVQTHALLPGSPAIEAGSSAFVVSPTFSGPPYTDARGAGFPRLLDSADANAVQTVDIGAYETHPTIEDITDKTTFSGTSLNVPFNVGDGTLGFSSITASSSNTSVVPNTPASLSITGSGSTRTLSVTPAGPTGSTTIMVTVTSSINGTFFSASDSFSLTVTAPPDLSITKTHSGSFTQGQTGAVYTLTVANVGAPATSGNVTVHDTLPAGLTATAMSGAGWMCSIATLTCTRTDPLSGGASYPPISLTVSVDSHAAPQLTNTASASGGGDANTANNTASDPTAIIQLPDLVISKSHTGSFTQGQTGAQYTLTVHNQGTGLSSNIVTVKDTLPDGLTATAISGSGWTCDLPTLTCTRADSLAAGQSYPPISLTVDVSTTAPASLTNIASVSGGGDAVTTNNNVSDSTAILQAADLVITKTHTSDFRQGQKDAFYALTVNNLGPSDTGGEVTLTDILPDALTATAIE